MRLRSRFTFLFAILSAAAVLLLMRVSDATLRRAVEGRVSDRVTRELEQLSDDLGRMSLDAAARDAFLRQAARNLQCRITFIAPEGRVLDDTDLLPADVPGMENHATRPEVLAAKGAAIGRSRRFSATEQRPMLYIARRLADGSTLRLAVSEAHLRQVELTYVWSLRVAIFVTCSLLFLIGAGASRRFSEPIAELTRAASAVAAGDFARDLPRSGGEEVQLLAAALQRMKESLSRALALAEEERRLTSLAFERLPDGLVVVDSRLHVVESNDRFARMTGVRAPVGRALYDLLRERTLYDAFEATVRSGEVSERTVRLEDDRVWALVVQPLPAGSRAAAVGVLRDITVLERTESMRRTFVADVSHELRTPIASIAAAAETLADGQADRSETAELLGLIRRQSDRMRELIDDLMDLAQIESGTIPLEREEIHLHELLAELAEDLEAAARERQVKVDVSGDPDLTVLGDRRRIGQLARNLVDNAIKFSPSGARVSIRVSRDGGRPGFSVSDFGPGIPKAERDKIFQRFYQVDRSRSKVRPGSGLGLAIVKHIAQLHGASVEVEGDVGKGSTFHVRFPASA
ncbi:MAG TPA: ATP-binding protein [Thermoanaerobaculia bacterium]|jgi:two-component system phosphate regulon sensor histidine kinase PhoR